MSHQPKTLATVTGDHVPLVNATQSEETDVASSAAEIPIKHFERPASSGYAAIGQQFSFARHARPDPQLKHPGLEKKAVATRSAGTVRENASLGVDVSKSGAAENNG